ncbi:hypothetical protein D3C80_1380690 [compost metagenome]
MLAQVGELVRPLVADGVIKLVVRAEEQACTLVVTGRGQSLDQVRAIAKRVGLGVEGISANQRAVGERLRVAAGIGHGDIDIIMPLVLQQVRMKCNP